MLALLVIVLLLTAGTLALVAFSNRLFEANRTRVVRDHRSSAALAARATEGEAASPWRTLVESEAVPVGAAVAPRPSRDATEPAPAPPPDSPGASGLRAA